MPTPRTTLGRAAAIGALVACTALTAGCVATPPAASPAPSAVASVPSGTTSAGPSPVPSVPSASSGVPSPVPSAPSSAAISASPVPSAPSSAGTSASPVPSAPAAPVAASGDECTGLQRVPPGASTTRVADGAEETLFLTTSAPWCFGVRTATRVFALADPLPGHGRHAVWGVATDGATGRAVVLDDGRTALVYRLQDSGLQQLRTQSGDPLEFPVGATTAGGHGVACNDRNGGILIERATTRQRSDGRIDVLWATVSSVDDAGVARVSAPEVRYASLPAGDERVAQAATSRCSAAPQRAVALHP